MYTILLQVSHYHPYNCVDVHGYPCSGEDAKFSENGWLPKSARRFLMKVGGKIFAARGAVSAPPSRAYPSIAM